MAAIKNKLIDNLPANDRKRLLSVCERMDLPLSEVLYEYGAPAHHVYFPIGGFISLVTPLDGKPVIEVGMVGAEGMLGTQVVLGVDTTPWRALVQGSGPTWRASAPDFRRELQRSPALTRTLTAYIYVCMLQMASMAACLRYHKIGPRLARWLLMMHDRSSTEQFQITQAFLAYMLGVRRVGITSAASELQRTGLIKYHRGELSILNRKGLEAAACSCYDSEKRSYAKYLP